MSSKTTLDLLAALQTEFVPLNVDVSKTSHDARMIFLGLLALGEQLKEARDDRRETATTSAAETVNRDDPFAHCTEADFEEMAREAMHESVEHADDDCRDADHDPHSWTIEGVQDVEGGSDDC